MRIYDAHDRQLAGGIAAAERRITVGRRGGGADVEIGRRGETGLSATAVVLDAQLLPRTDPALPPRRWWSLCNTNQHRLVIRVDGDGTATDVLPGNHTLLPGSCRVRLLLADSGPVRLRVELGEWETPFGHDLPAVARGTTAPMRALTPTQIRTVRAVFPDLAAGARPSSIRPSAEAATLLNVSVKTLSRRLEHVRRRVDPSGESGLGLLSLDLGVALYERGWH